MGRHETQERNTIVFGNDVLPISLHSSITVDSPSVSSLSRRGSARASARSIWMSLWRGKRWLALAPSWFRVFTRHSISKRRFWWSKTSQRRTEKRFTETSSTVNISVFKLFWVQSSLPTIGWQFVKKWIFFKILMVLPSYLMPHGTPISLLSLVCSLYFPCKLICTETLDSTKVFNKSLDLLRAHHLHTMLWEGHRQ